jgi:hypothetical protein
LFWRWRYQDNPKTMLCSRIVTSVRAVHLSEHGILCTVCYWT